MADPPNAIFEREPEPSRESVLEFELLVDPEAKTMDVIGIGRNGRALVPANVVQDGVAGSGPADSVELVTTSVATDMTGAGACGFPSSFCSDVTVRSFYGVRLTNVYVQITQITPAAGHLPLNSSPSAFGLSNALGLWDYDQILSGGAQSRQWVFQDDGTAFRVRGRVMMQVATGCAGLLAEDPSLPDGVYAIDPDGGGSAAPFEAFCDMTRDDGGWTLLFTISPSFVTNGIINAADWPDDFHTGGGPPATSGLYKGTLAPFSEVREEVNSGQNVVYGRNLSQAQLNVIREQYGNLSRTVSAPNFVNRPNCRSSYAGATDNIVGCSPYTMPNNRTVLGWQVDVFGTTHCWFARGNCCSTQGGSARCIGGGDVNGTRWARTWFR